MEYAQKIVDFCYYPLRNSIFKSWLKARPHWGPFHVRLVVNKRNYLLSSSYATAVIQVTI